MRKVARADTISLEGVPWDKKGNGRQGKRVVLSTYKKDGARTEQF